MNEYRQLPVARLCHVDCDLCGSRRSIVVMKKRGDLYDYEFTVVRCIDCGLVFVNPRLDDDAIAGLYDSQYYEGLGFDKTVCYERDSKLTLAQIRRLNQDFVATIGDALSGLKGRSILDIGCGMGGVGAIALRRRRRRDRNG